VAGSLWQLLCQVKRKTLLVLGEKIPSRRGGLFLFLVEIGFI